MDESDVIDPLEQRTAIANREGADLFLSIHANASRDRKARGIETYFLNFAPNPEIHVTDQTPPSFIVQAEDDPVHVENSTVYFLALKNAKVPAELHLYAQGGHGYGLRRTTMPVTTWPQSVETWLHTIQILP